MATEELNSIAQVLEASLDPRQNKQGEDILRENLTGANVYIRFLAELTLQQQEQRPGYSLALLRIVATEQYSGTIRLAGALCFKNFIKRKWVVSCFVTRLLRNNPVLTCTGRGWEPPVTRARSHGNQGGDHRSYDIRTCKHTVSAWGCCGSHSRQRFLEGMGYSGRCWFSIRRHTRTLQLKHIAGSHFSPYAGQHQGQQRSFAGGTFHFQTMETTISV